jgi:hypothetical protein
MSDDELDDAKDAIREQNLDPDDFELSHRDTSGSGPGIIPIQGEITICNKKTGATKVYATGHGTAWPATFGDDLAAGAFR